MYVHALEKYTVSVPLYLPTIEIVYWNVSERERERERERDRERENVYESFGFIKWANLSFFFHLISSFSHLLFRKIISCKRDSNSVHWRRPPSYV